MKRACKQGGSLKENGNSVPIYVKQKVRKETDKQYWKRR